MSRDPKTALVVVDVQNLAVPGGDRLASRIRAAAASAGTLVATRDTAGAELHDSLAGLAFDRTQDKGEHAGREQGSGFDATSLADWLRGRGVERVLVAGLATDGVRATALDAIRAGFETTVLIDAVAAVEPGDGARALAEIRAAGGRLDRVELLRGADVLEPLLDRKQRRLRELLDGAGRGRVVIGLSGGIDSAVAMALAAKAIGPEHVVAVRLPSRHTEQVHLDDAAAAAAAAGLPDENLLTISIEPLLDGLASVRAGVVESDIRFGNASARARMVLVYDLSQELHALVLGTENRSENLLGYFTRFGDAASDIEPITDLYKTEVRTAAHLLGQPESVITKHPTAGLWGGQTDEQELGFSYHDADLALVAMFELGLDEHAAAARTGVDPEVVRQVRARADVVAWKHAVPLAL